jgi:hypothetical protein
MKIEIEGFPSDLPAGTYDVLPLEVTYGPLGEPIMKMVFSPPKPPPEPETTFLLVEVEKDWANHTIRRLPELAGVKMVTVHNEDHPHGCCCQHCPHRGNCRD